MKHKLLLIFCCLATLGGIVVTACKPRPVSDKPSVFVTIEPLRFFAEQIAGNHFDIQTMVPTGSSPETYDPTPQQLMDLTECKAFLTVGQLGFEKQWIPKLAKNAPNVTFKNTSEGITYLESSHHHEGEEHGKDPHTWTSPSCALVICKNICNLFCEIDPEHQDEYTQNYTRLVTLIQQTDAEVRKVVNDEMQKTFAIYHPTLTYFANDYQLKQLCIEDEGKEPSPAQLKSLILQCRQNDVKVIFVQKEFNTHNAEIIAKEIGAKIVTINPLSYNWQEEIIHIANSLKK